MCAAVLKLNKLLIGNKIILLHNKSEAMKNINYYLEKNQAVYRKLIIEVNNVIPYYYLFRYDI